MPYIVIKNKTKHDIDFLKKAGQLLKPYIHLVDKSKYPFKVIVTDKKNFYDRSKFDLESNILYFKLNLDKQSKEDALFVFCHEFAHFLCNNNEELRKTCLSPEYAAMIKILKEKYHIDDDELTELFHDFLPPEVFANGFATMLVGKFFKRHPFSNVKRYIYEKDGIKAKETNK